MTDPVKEQLSACLDGELPEAELGLLLKQVQRDPQVLASMNSYSLISEVIRGSRPVAVSANFADRLAAAIDAEPAPNAAIRRPAKSSLMQWMRPAAGMAVAAGVAAIAVIAFQPDPIATQQVAAVADTASDAGEAAPSYTVPTNVDAAADTAFVPAARLTNYVVAHSEYSSPLGRRTVLSGVLSDDDDPEQDVAVTISGSPSSMEPQR